MRKCAHVPCPPYRARGATPLLNARCPRGFPTTSSQARVAGAQPLPPLLFHPPSRARMRLALLSTLVLTSFRARREVANIADMQEIVAWLRRLANLDTRVFDEVRTNPTATLPGVLVAAVSILISGLGGWLWWVINDFPNSGDILINSAFIGSLLAFVLWGLVWLGIVYVMLTQVFRERAYVEQLLRVMGLAASPLALMGFMFIPGLSLAIGLASLALTFGLTNIAIRSVTTADPARVLVANLLGFFVWSAALTLLASAGATTVEPHAPGIFLFNTVTSIASDILNASV